jgi:hypothetical protein
MYEGPVDMFRAPIFLHWVRRLADSVACVVQPASQSLRKNHRSVGRQNGVEALESRTLLTTFAVDTLEDVVSDADSVTSLREAIQAANNAAGADTIQFTSTAHGTFKLTLGELNVTDTLTIQGHGAAQTVIDADGRSRGIHFEALTGDLTLNDLAIRNADDVSFFGGGGVAFDSAGQLTLSSCDISGNRSASNGGGIRLDSGTLNVTNSTVSGNISLFNGGGISLGSGPVTLKNSTISGNSSFFDGGGLSSHGGLVTLVNSTVTANSAFSGGGIYLYLNAASLDVKNSIIAKNTVGEGSIGPDMQFAEGTLATLDHSLIGSNDGTTLTAAATADANGNLIGSSTTPIDPKLGPLADNGGPTRTHALLRGSPALNAGSDADAQGLQFDQRGASFPRKFGSFVDMGAFESQEVQSMTFTVTTNSDVVNAQDGQTSLREAISLANSNPGADSIVFAPGLSGTMLMTGGEFVITDTVTIQGQGSGQTIVDAQQNSRVFHFTAATGDLNVNGLTIQNGKVTGNEYGGGVLFDSSGTVTLTNSTVSGNTANRSGGLYSHSGSISLTNSTVSGNTAKFVGGGLASYSGSIFLTNSTVSGNTATFVGGGGLASNSGSISLTNSTVSGNTANFSGGGLYSGSGSISLTNSTISGNTANFSGGGLCSYSGSISLTNSTVSGNVAKYGAGIYLNKSEASLTATNSIVARNSLTSGGSAPDVLPKNGGSITLDHTLIGDNSETTLSASATVDANGNLIGSSFAPIDPLLGPLADNGGPTKTHSLLPGSPALNAGSNTGAVGLQFDQRGQSFARIFGGTVDMGAFELSIPKVSFSTSSSVVNEGTATTEVTVNLSFAFLNDVTILFSIAGTADIPDDFNIPTNLLVIPAGQTSATINVTIVDDSQDENDETVIITLESLTNAVLGGTSVHTLTIQDNDPPPTVSFESVSQAVNEDAGAVTLTVTLNTMSASEVVVPFTVGGTADTADFTIPTSSVVIPAGQTSGTISVNVVNDSLDENDETVTVTLGTPNHATLGTDITHTLTIVDDDINAAPAIPSGQVFSIAENSAANTVVGTVAASDPEHEALTFAILMGTPDNPFTIDPSTGKISVSDPRPKLDFESTQSYVLQVQVKDSANNASLQSVTVNLANAPEIPVINGAENLVTYVNKGQPVALFPQLTITSAGEPYSLKRLIMSYSVPKGGTATDVVADFSALGQVEVSGLPDFKKQGGTRTITVSFYADITIDQVQHAVRGIQFATRKLDPKAKPLNRAISVQVIDDSSNPSNTVTTQIRTIAKVKKVHTNPNS